MYIVNDGVLVKFAQSIPSSRKKKNTFEKAPFAARKQNKKLFTFSVSATCTESPEAAEMTVKSTACEEISGVFTSDSSESNESTQNLQLKQVDDTRRVEELEQEISKLR